MVRREDSYRNRQRKTAAEKEMQVYRRGRGKTSLNSDVSGRKKKEHRK